MRAKEFTRETIAPIAPVAPVATRPIDKVIAQTGRPSGPAGIDQTIAATPAKPTTPYNQSALGTGIGKIGKGLSALAKNPLGKVGRGFAQGFYSGLNSTISSPSDDAGAYLKKISKGEKVNPTGNDEIDKLLKAQGLL
jgi:hypothetical protein